MTELEKMRAYHAMEELKTIPQWAQEFTLVRLCRFDKTGQIEKTARIFAAHKMPIDEIVPCLMEIMQNTLMDIKADGKEILK